MFSADSFALLFYESLCPMIIYDPVELSILEANNSAISLYGYTPTAFKKMKISELHPKDELERLNTVLADNVLNKKRVGHWRHLTKEGKFIDVEVFSHLLKIEGKRYRLMQVWDRTKIKKELDRLKSSEELYRSLIDDYPMAIWVVDLSKVKRQLSSLKIENKTDFVKYIESDEPLLEEVLEKLKVIFINRAAYSLYGAKNKSDLLKNTGTFFNNIYTKSKIEFLSSLNMGLTDTEMKTVCKTISGESFDAQINWHVIHGHEKQLNRVLVSILDITSLKKAEQSIRRLENRFKAIFQSSELGIAIIDKNRRFIESNDALTRIIGYSNDTLKKMTLEKILLPEKENTTKTLLKDLFEEYNPVIKLEERVICENKTINWLKFTISKIIEDEPGPEYAIAIIEDITEMRNKEEERDQLFRDNNAAQERLRDLSKFLIKVQEKERGVIARELHDEIGQVLTAIKIEMQTASVKSQDIKIKEHMAEGVELVEHAISKARDLSINLRPSILDDIGLIPALRWYIDKQSQRSNIEMKFTSGIKTKRFNSEIEITIYRVVQEAITNIQRHSRAKNVKVDILEIPDTIFLKIEDDGKGFYVSDAMKRAKGGKSMGLTSMVERVELIGGKLIYSSSPEKRQTIITAQFPTK